MKIVWITNNLSHINWIESLLKIFATYNEHQLIVVSTGNVHQTLYKQKNGINYFLLPGGYPINYNHKLKTSITNWKKFFEKEKPDIFMIWGSEFTHGLAALIASPNTPAVINIQGILDAIARFYYAGIDHKELARNVTFRDIIKRDSISQQKEKYQKRAIFEKEMYIRAGNIISENSWASTIVKAIAPKVRTYYCPLSLNEEFLKHGWNINKIERHTIMTSSAGYPLKGLHIILRAVALVKKKYPDVRLYVPGKPQISDGSIQWLVRKDGYTNYIEKLIKQLDVKDNITWTGTLSANQMAKRMSKVNSFVLVSALENISSTLKEAMLVGTPCISSAVGGIPEYIEHGENGLLYRFGDHEKLAEHLYTIFQNDDIAKRFSQKCKTSITTLHFGESIYYKLIKIYEEIIKVDNAKT